MCLPDPGGAGLHRNFQFLYVRSLVRPSLLVKVDTYTAIIPRTLNIFTGSEPLMKLLIWVPIMGGPDPPNPPYGGPKYF